MHTQDQYLLASIVESSQDSIVSIDLNRNITSWNKGAELLYGYTAEEVIGKPLALVMLPEDILTLMGNVHAIIHELTVPVYETVRLHKNGKHADLEILLSPVRNRGGQVIGISTVARDISIRKMQEQQKDDFIAVASHELKSPVTSIKAYAELVLEQLESLGDDANASMIRKLDQQIDRLIELIGTLLDTTKLTAGDVLLNREEFDLNVLIREQIEDLSNSSNKHIISFHAGNIRPMSADRKLIGRVLINIISNAQKYSPGGSEIIVSTKETTNGVGISVQDFGVGIPDMVKDRIFERYFRVDSPVTAVASGIGLGLYITAKIIQQHRGTISVQSEEGIGSTFFLTLPYGTIDEAGNHS